MEGVHWKRVCHFYDYLKECTDESSHAKNDDFRQMSILLEFLHEHALCIDFGMLILIWMVQIIVYPTFHKVVKEDFVTWHRNYCNAIGFFVLPVMVCQLMEASSACFFTAENLAWVKLLAVLGGWAITFLISAPCHRNLQEGKDTLVIERLVRTNWWRTVLWTIVFVVSVVIYYS